MMNLNTVFLRSRDFTHYSLSLTTGLINFAKDIKISHSIFALPFAISVFFITNVSFPTLQQATWLLICMICARSFAMGYNRLSDADIDSLNPRTNSRALPSGRITKEQSLFWIFFFAAAFIFAAFKLNPLAGYLSLPLLGILGLYSKMKHLHWLTHIYLGACLGLSPIAVVVAINGSFDFHAILLGCAILCWTAGFDILYSLQDQKFDQKMHLKSIPAYFGVQKSLIISRFLFALMVGLLLVIGLTAELGLPYFLGVLIISTLLFYEHFLIRDSKEDALSNNIGTAFFNANASVSLIYAFFAALDALWVRFP
ncbi:MAG: putative 4-hydroxybenzoate polyprenyltransferase [Oligoflexales bacterium]|nr:putative 4-hydroxybenzoate polyprenyltransferase [Oligoflexales bacterium]